MRAPSPAPILALAIAACTPEVIPAVPPPPAPPPPTATASAPPPPAPPPPEAPPPAPPAPWALVYRRACNASITPPVLSPDGSRVGSCGALFEAARGRFLGAAPFGLMAMLPGERAIVDEHSSGGL